MFSRVLRMLVLACAIIAGVGGSSAPVEAEILSLYQISGSHTMGQPAKKAVKPAARKKKVQKKRVAKKRKIYKRKTKPFKKANGQRAKRKKYVAKKRRLVKQKKRVAKKTIRVARQQMARSAPGAISMPSRKVAKSAQLTGRKLAKNNPRRKLEATPLRESKIILPKKDDAKPLTRKQKLQAIIRKYAVKENVPVKLAYAVAQIESNYRPHVTGPSGSVGLMQIKYSTAKGLGYRGTRKALYNPETNVKYAMKYLAGAFRRSKGHICKTILGYNAGWYAKRMNPISARYCRRTIAMIGKKYISPASVIAQHNQMRLAQKKRARLKLARREAEAAHKIVAQMSAARHAAPINRAILAAPNRRNCEKQEKSLWVKIANLLEPVMGTMTRKDENGSVMGVKPRYRQCS